MTDPFHSHASDRAGETGSERRSWEKPRLHRMHAGRAEIGPNPIVDEGPIGRGNVAS